MNRAPNTGLGGKHTCANHNRSRAGLSQTPVTDSEARDPASHPINRKLTCPIMENELCLLVTMAFFCALLRVYVFFVSLGLSINVLFHGSCCVDMFSAMIISNILGQMNLTVVFGGLFILCLSVLTTCLILLRFSQGMDQKLNVLMQKVSERIETKMCKHWKMMVFMAFLRWCGIFEVYTLLDETLWTCYAAFIDD